MPGGRPHLPPGSWGEINAAAVPGAKKPTYKARARFRDRHGALITVARFGQTEGEAKKRLRVALAEMAAGATALSRDVRVATLADRWLEEVDADPRKSSGTREHYRYVVDRYIRPVFGQLRIGEATTGRCDDLLQRVAAVNGPSAARSTRSVLNGMFRLAVRHGALVVSPVRETRPVHVQPRQARALLRDEETRLIDLMRCDARAVLLDLPDLAEFALATACRIGEVLSVRDTVLDLDDATLEVNATAVRIKGEGVVIQERPKTDAGHRILPMPSFAVAMLTKRRTELRLRPPAVKVMDDHGVIRTEALWVAFPAPLARTLRDPSNTAGDLRELLDRLGCPDCGGKGWHPHLKTVKQQERPPSGLEVCAGEPPFAWVTSHTFRKTALSRLYDAGLTDREVSDFAGHAQVSMTQDVYAGRKVVSRRAAAALDR